MTSLIKLVEVVKGPRMVEVVKGANSVRSSSSFKSVKSLVSHNLTGTSRCSVHGHQFSFFHILILDHMIRPELRLLWD